MADVSNANNFFSNLQSNFKTVYADTLNKLVPEDTKLLGEIPFAASPRLGKAYEQAVSLSYGAGFSFAGTEGDLYDLNDAQVGLMKTARIDANEYLLREYITNKALARCEDGKKSSFVDATKHVVKGMNVSYSKMMETQLLYGGSGLGKVENVVGNVVTITAATWADGIWVASAPSRLVQVYNGNARRVATGGGEITLAAGGETAARVTKVNPATRSITLSNVAAIAAGDDIYLAGSKGKEMLGIHAILSNTGVLFNIDAADSELWAGNQVAVGGVLTLNKIIDSVTAAVAKGLSGVKTKLFVSTKTFNDLLKELADARTIDASYSTAKQVVGTDAIEVRTAAGPVEVVPHTFVKGGFAYQLVMDDFIRIGSRDKSFTMPGEDGQFWKEVPNKAAKELRIYSDQAIFCTNPGRQILFTGIA